MEIEPVVDFDGFIRFVRKRLDAGLADLSDPRAQSPEAVQMRHRAEVGDGQSIVVRKDCSWRMNRVKWESADSENSLECIFCHYCEGDETMKTTSVNTGLGDHYLASMKTKECSRRQRATSAKKSGLHEAGDGGAEE